MKINEKIQNRVEEDSKVLEKIVNDIVKKQTKDLDDYIQKIKEVLEESSEDITTDDLNRILIRLCSYAYFISSKQELMGIRQDIADAIRQEKYNTEYMNITSGTIARKVAQAEEAVKEEAVVALIYNRAYKIFKNKYDTTLKMIDAIKKIQSIRLSLMNLGVREC